MRRQTITAAIDVVANDIKQSGITEMLTRGIEATRRTTSKDSSSSSWVSYGTLQNLFVCFSRYGAAEKSLLDALELERLFIPDFWDKLVQNAEVSTLMSLRTEIRYGLLYLPRFASLVQQDYVTEVENNSDHLPSELKSLELLRVTLVEEANTYSSPERIIQMLNGVSMLYKAHAKLNSSPENTLIVLAVDSGSDKSFDFLGLAHVIPGVKDTILAIWDRRVFHRYEQVNASLDLIARALPIIQQVDDLANKGNLSPQQAKMIKDNIIGGATKFLQSGAVTSEMEIHSSQSPRALMQPERALLAAPQQSRSLGGYSSDALDEASGNFDSSGTVETPSNSSQASSSRSAPSRKATRPSEPKASASTTAKGRQGKPRS